MFSPVGHWTCAAGWKWHNDDIVQIAQDRHEIGDQIER
jgi:hypothetical protein